jgi:hypothetical protein
MMPRAMMEQMTSGQMGQPAASMMCNKRILQFQTQKVAQL